ncbi:carbonic anhydrase [Marivivens aquimaris]|uniref:carbonic anhydrase n=1 Tax=Marivivens aquimaris TaxID=2774876 RepID=UPI0018820C0A|nr:carbonic anhydrase family protein [Marivivens aquimaris]
MNKLGFAGISLAASLLAMPVFAAGTHWTYSGDEGPDHWGELSEEYASCAGGAMQSPIDLSGAEASGTVNYEFDYQPVALNILNNGHTVQFNTAEGGDLVEAGKTFHLAQIHFHTPSEHDVDGKEFPIEAHFVHQADDGALAVLGVLIEEGEANATLQTVIDNMPTTPTEAADVAGVTIDPNGLIPASHEIYRYMGSLTTPPCSEGVNWHVLATPMTASAEQIAALSEVLNHNNRPLQQLNARLLVGPSGN